MNDFQKNMFNPSRIFHLQHVEMLEIIFQNSKNNFEKFRWKQHASNNLQKEDLFI